MTTDSKRQTPTDIYERVTSQIIAAIEAGADQYRMPWHHDGSAITTPVNVASQGLSWRQRHRTLGRRARRRLSRRHLGHLSPVAGARRAGPQG